MTVAFDMSELAGEKRKVTVLLVEDEILIRAQLTDELEDQGYTVIEAANSDEALSLLRSNAGIDVLITDVRMPEGSMDGIALSRMVRSLYPSTKIVITSGHVGEADARDFDGFFPKPCDIAPLLAHLSRLLGDEESADTRGPPNSR